MPAQVNQWVEEACETGERLAAGGSLDRPLPEELARLHDDFERVHPFIDGNGRAGRLLLNLILVRLGYPPVIIFKRQRDAYLAAMQRADLGDYGALGELIARAMYDNLNRFIVPNVARACPPRTARGLGDNRFQSSRLATGRPAWTSGRGAGGGRHLAKFPQSGRGVPDDEEPEATSFRMKLIQSLRERLCVGYYWQLNV